MANDTEALKIICAAVVRLTETKIKNCPGITIENFSSDLFYKLLRSYALAGAQNSQSNNPSAISRPQQFCAVKV